MTIVSQLAAQPVPGHPDWRASSDGHIYRTNGEQVPEYPKERGENRLRIRCKAHDYGYHTVARLVGEAFFGSVPSGFAVVHQNGAVADNRVANLHIERNAGSHSNHSPRKLLTEEQKEEVHRQLDAGIPKTQIAKSLGISPRAVRYHATSCSCNFGPSAKSLL